jgi:ketosteroid isomerase-like protein
MDNVELAKQGYKDFAAGNIEEVLKLFDPQIEWNECIGFPFVSGDGKYIGSNSVAQDVFAQIPKYYDEFNINIQELIGSEDRIVMVGYYTGVWKETGKKFKANAAHVWNVKDGKLTRFFQAVDTAAIINP